jgi:hypothetical protein
VHEERSCCSTLSLDIHTLVLLTHPHWQQLSSVIAAFEILFVLVYTLRAHQARLRPVWRNVRRTCLSKLRETRKRAERERERVTQSLSLSLTRMSMSSFVSERPDDRSSPFHIADVLGNILSFVGPGHWLFVALVSIQEDGTCSHQAGCCQWASISAAIQVSCVSSSDDLRPSCLFVAILPQACWRKWLSSRSVV